METRTMETRKVKILKDTVAGGELVKKGQTVVVSQRDAHVLTNIGRATYTDRMMEPEGTSEMTSETTATSKGKKTK